MNAQTALVLGHRALVHLCSACNEKLLAGCLIGNLLMSSSKACNNMTCCTQSKQELHRKEAGNASSLTVAC